ncbi:hypothetical protein TYRP_006200 [Tyrophagus putrescentiae]|nr:hypothetical protein TYRP_006200 [Tyrophagus putrescentiae]
MEEADSVSEEPDARNRLSESPKDANSSRLTNVMERDACLRRPKDANSSTHQCRWSGTWCLGVEGGEFRPTSPSRRKGGGAESESVKGVRRDANRPTLTNVVERTWCLRVRGGESRPTSPIVDGADLVSRSPRRGEFVWSPSYGNGLGD